VILLNLGSFDIRKRQWLPLLRRRAIAEIGVQGSDEIATT
jgi:hypothetical protein